jgi:anti-sigma-K factor RskA
VWNPDQRQAVLFAAGLPPAPAGKAYEAWVIAGAAPVAAGLFRVADESGTALHTLPRLDDVARARTFAVTLEPEAGVKAPTGPMVLAGPAI